MEWPKEHKDRKQLGLRNSLELGLEQGRGLSESFLSPFYLCDAHWLLWAPMHMIMMMIMTTRGNNNELLVYVRHCAKHFICISSLNPH